MGSGYFCVNNRIALDDILMREDCFGGFSEEPAVIPVGCRQ